MLSPIERPIPPGIDPGILPVVEMLYRNGIRTYESCEGGAGHCTAEPWVKFHGLISEAFLAASAVLFDPSHGLRPWSLAQEWTLHDGWPDGPVWLLRFHPINPNVLRTWNGRAASPGARHDVPDLDAASWKRRAEYAEAIVARVCSCPHGQAGNRTDADPACPVHADEYARSAEYARPPARPRPPRRPDERGHRRMSGGRAMAGSASVWSGRPLKSLEALVCQAVFVGRVDIEVRGLERAQGWMRRDLLPRLPLLRYRTEPTQVAERTPDSLPATQVSRIPFVREHSFGRLVDDVGDRGDLDPFTAVVIEEIEDRHFDSPKATAHGLSVTQRLLPKLRHYPTAGWLALLALAAIALLAYPVAAYVAFRMLGHPEGSRLLPEHRRLLDGGLW